MSVKTPDALSQPAITSSQPLSLDDRIRAWTSKTPEQAAKARARVLALSPDPRLLPPGKTLEEVVVGKWPGEETEKEILALLQDL